jgi:hypothetical protein
MPAQKKTSTNKSSKPASPPKKAAKAAKTPSSYIPADAPYEMRGSVIHGRGLYARRDIKRGERVVEYIGEKITKGESNRRGNALLQKAKETGEGAVYIFILNSKHDIDGACEANVARLMNHSCVPNCQAVIERGRIWYHALRRIPKGTELTINYGFDVENWHDHPCHCGEPNCVGYIVAKSQWKRLAKEIAKKKAQPL